MVLPAHYQMINVPTLYLTPPHPLTTHPLTTHPLYLTPPHPPTPLHPSLYCTLQGTVDSTVFSDGGKGENSDPESEAVVTSTDAIN